MGFLVVILCQGGTSLARQDTEPDSDIGMEPSMAVIEVYLRNNIVGAAADYTRSIAFSIKGSGRYAVMDRSEVSSRFRSVLLTPLKRLQSERLNSIERLVREGDQLVYTDPKAAVEVLGRARKELESIAEGLSANKKLRDEYIKTQLLLARSHMDTGNDIKAGTILREVIRVYEHDLNVTERRYHPRLVTLFRQEQKVMKKMRKAVMTVATATPGCKTLMDGRVLLGSTPREYRGLYPGVHHVQIRCKSKESMIRKVVLGPDTPVHLVVDVAFENALTVEGGKLGLLFKDSRDLDRLLIPYAVKFGSLINSDLVVIQGFMDKASRSTLRAWLVDVKAGKVVEEASVPAKTEVVTPSSVQRLVQLIIGHEAFSKTEPEAVSVSDTLWYQNYWGWGLTVVGVGGLAAGGGLIWSYFDHKSNATSPYSDNNGRGSISEWDWKKSEAGKALDMRTASIACFGVGGAALITGIVLFVMTDEIYNDPADEKAADGSCRPRFFAAPSLTRHGAGFVGRIEF